MRINPCGVERAKVSLSERATKFVTTTKYVPKVAWKETQVGTNTHYSSENFKFKVDVIEGCFGRSTHVVDKKSKDAKHTHYLFKDASLDDLKEKMEKVLLPT